jgi:hypothetical protein
MRYLLILFVTVVSACFAAELKPINVAPPNAELEKFPVFKQGELTVSLAEPYLGLRLEKLKAPLVVLNHHREDNSWRLQALLAGDEVWVEKANGTPRYRAACSNRIVLFPAATTFTVVRPEDSGLPKTGSSIHTTGWGPSLSDRIANKFSRNFGDSTEALAGLLGWVIPWIIFGLAGLAIWLLWQRRQTPPPPLVIGSGNQRSVVSPEQQGLSIKPTEPPMSSSGLAPAK